MAKKPKMIEVDILDMELSQDLPHWLDPIEKFKGHHDADRKRRNIQRSNAIQGKGSKSEDE